MDLGLYDYVMIAVYGITFVLVVLTGMGIVAAWPVIAQFGRASFQRFFVFEWSGLPDRIADMSSSAPDFSFVPNSAERRSYAVEQPTEQPGTAAAFPVPALVAALEQLDDEVLLDILAQLKKDGCERFADSRIAKFVGGRIEDRVAQVRDVRAKSAPPKQPDARQLTIRSRAEGERVVSLN